KKLKRLKNWWDSTDILGPLHSSLQQQVREAFYENIQYCDDFPHLYKFLLQVLFSSETGLCLPTDIFSNDIRQLKKIAVGYESCKVFAKVIQSLGPFTLQNLIVNTIKFEDKSPILALVSNIPFIQTINIMDCPSDRGKTFYFTFFKCLSKWCPILKVLEINFTRIDKSLKKVEILYEVFYDGMSKKNVLENIENMKDVSLTFPCMKFVRINMLSFEFCRNLAYSTAEVMFIYKLKKNFSTSPCMLRRVYFNSEILGQLTYSEKVNIKYLFPNMKHLALTHDYDSNYHYHHNHALFCARMKTNLIYLMAENLISHLALKFDGFYSSFSNTSDIHLFMPSFQMMGNKLESFTIIIAFCKAQELCSLIDLCSRAISIRVNRDRDINTNSFLCSPSEVKFSPKPYLRSLAIVNEESSNRPKFRSEFQYIVKGLLQVSPHLETLEIDVREVKSVSEILFELNSKGIKSFQNSLTKLTLIRESAWSYGVSRNLDVGYGVKKNGTYLSTWLINDIRNLIESLPFLKAVVMHFRLSDVKYFKSVYKGTAIDIFHGKSHGNEFVYEYY
ncbi:unnamed protein product, partial [Meganyctiphanes norvegica]